MDSFVSKPSCPCMQGCIGYCGSPKIPDLQRAIQETQAQNFRILFTEKLNHTMDTLVSITATLKFASEMEKCTMTV